MLEKYISIRQPFNKLVHLRLFIQTNITIFAVIGISLCLVGGISIFFLTGNVHSLRNTKYSLTVPNSILPTKIVRNINPKTEITIVQIAPVISQSQLQALSQPHSSTFLPSQSNNSLSPTSIPSPTLLVQNKGNLYKPLLTNTSKNISNSSSSDQSRNSNSNQSLPTPTPVTQISIVFQSPNGQTQIYTPSESPPIQISWGRYTNTLDNYSIDYPTDWQVFRITDNGHEGLSIYPPGGDTSNPYGPHIGLGWSTYYSIPSTGQGQLYPTSIIVDNVPGTLYTQGSEGASYVASFFQYHQGYLGLGTSVSDQVLLYVFAHMIYSLTLNPS